MKYFLFFLSFVWVCWLVSLAGLDVAFIGIGLGFLLSFIIDNLRFFFDRFSDKEGNNVL